jgi:hypothetical protein
MNRYRVCVHMTADLMKELKRGGSESPCPFCGLPRVKRSDYIRCCRCGINWINGEALDKDPRSERMRKLVEDLKVSAMSRTKKE